ncbi:MAG: SRPBCC family protein [Pseudomonadota bacterium]|nr:SRPBCC family protein [Pseudomonadota bacterium]
MDAKSEAKRTTIEKKSDREIVVRRTFDAPARIVFEAWSKPELFKRWWVPKSIGMTLVSCEQDVRTGGRYRLEFGQGMAFFGRYVEVTPHSRIVWTNEESGEDGSVTTVTFDEQDGKTLLTLNELYPSKEAFERTGGAEDGLSESFDQLEALLIATHLTSTR